MAKLYSLQKPLKDMRSVNAANSLSGKPQKRAYGNHFLDASDEEMKEFFGVLDALESPDKERFFVEYCLNPSILQ